MVGIAHGRDRRVLSLLLAMVLIAGLMVITAAPASAGKGGNSTNAKLCSNWASLYRADGSTFVDRGACTDYAANGGTIYTTPPVQLNAFQQECLDLGGSNEAPYNDGVYTNFRCTGLGVFDFGDATDKSLAAACAASTDSFAIQVASYADGAYLCSFV